MNERKIVFKKKWFLFCLVLSALSFTFMPQKGPKKQTTFSLLQQGPVMVGTRLDVEEEDSAKLDVPGKFNRPGSRRCCLESETLPSLVVDRSSSRLRISSSFMSVMHMFRLCLLNSINLQCVIMRHGAGIRNQESDDSCKNRHESQS